MMDSYNLPPEGLRSVIVAFPNHIHLFCDSLGTLCFICMFIAVTKLGLKCEERNPQTVCVTLIWLYTCS